MQFRDCREGLELRHSAIFLDPPVCRSVLNVEDKRPVYHDLVYLISHVLKYGFYYQAIFLGNFYQASYSVCLGRTYKLRVIMHKLYIK
jgi:hypothetical protein